MDFKKFGGYLIALGLVLGCVAAYYAWLPHNMRWIEADAIMDSIKRAGYSAKLADVRLQFETFNQRKIGFGIAGAVSIFLGMAMIWSARSNLDDDADQKICPFCAESIKPEAAVCKHCGKDQPPVDPALHEKWVCQHCHAICKGTQQSCWVCNKPRHPAT